MLQLELILLCYSFISVVFRAQALSQPSSLPLQSWPVLSCSPLVLSWSAPCRSPRFPSSRAVPAHQQTAPRAGAVPEVLLALRVAQAQGQTRRGTLVNADGGQSPPFPGASREPDAAPGQRGGGERLFSLRRARQQFRTTLESLLNVWKLQSWNSFRRDPSLHAYSFLYFPFLSTDWRETGRTNHPSSQKAAWNQRGK